MIITAAPRRDIDVDDFTDITTVAVVDIRWNETGLLEVEFASDLTLTEAEAVKRRIESRNANEELLRMQAEQALQNNRDFLAIATPTQAQSLAQIRALTRQSNGVIRMLLGQLDGTN